MGLDRWFFHHDNAPPHRAAATVAYMNSAHFNLVSHPPYSPDLAPPDFFLFAKMKTFLGGKHFESVEEAETALDWFLGSITLREWNGAFDSWRRRMQRCIELDGDYVE